MLKSWRYWFAGSVLLAFGCTLAFGADPPSIPVGYDAYLQWHKWPQQRVGARAYMRSTYDRRGNNEGADSSHYLYQAREDFNVTLDVEGKGMLYFARYNHWHGSPWHYEVDGSDYIVKETTTADPYSPLEDAVFLPQAALPQPLTFTYATTKGADLMWVPIGFQDRFRMAYSRTCYGTGYYIYHQYLPGASLSQPIEPWNDSMTPPTEVLDFLRSAGTDIAPHQQVEQQQTSKSLAPGEAMVVELEGAKTIRAFRLSVPADAAVASDDLWIRMTWDGREAPSVDSPAPLLFGTGTFFNPSNREYLVKALPVNVRFRNGRMELGSYFPMPFFQSARIELINKGDAEIDDLRCEVRTEEYTGRPNEVGYFHATYVDHPNPEMGQDLVFLDTDQVEGGGSWSGSFVGTSFIFSDRGRLWTLEGDPRFFFDDSQSAQAYGTGTEEWGGGGDYWGGEVMTLPLAGHPVGTAGHPRGGRQLEVEHEKGLIESAYRYLLADLMPFGRRAVIRFEHGGINNFPEHYQSLTYWYGAPFETLKLTDTLEIGDLASEAAHEYHSPEATEPEVVTSRFEWGPDRVPLSGSMPLVQPDDYADFEFQAKADTPYYIWVRGRSSGDLQSDATWFQFDQDIGIVRSFYATQEKGFGNWRDDTPAGQWSWSSELPGQPPKTVEFDRPGRHRLRVQSRHGGHDIDRIWFSTTQRERPASDYIPVEDNDNIVLTVDEASVIKGAMERQEADGQSVLHVGGGSKAWLETYPAHAETGRTTTTSSEFTLAIDPENVGVLLRRLLDYSYPNQRAIVKVANDDGRWHHAGVWYLAGSNTCYFSSPRGPRRELGKSNPQVQTSNRRFREDEFMIPKDLTAGRDRIRVRIEFEPANIPLLPDSDLPEQAWSEMRYKAYSFVFPDWAPEAN